MPKHHMCNFFVSNVFQKISAHYMHIYLNLLDTLLTQTQIRVFVNKVVRKVSGPEWKEVIWGSRILHYECTRCEVLSDKYWNTVLWEVAPCSFIATTWNHIPEGHDLNFMNTFTNFIFKICVCICVCVCVNTSKTMRQKVQPYYSFIHSFSNVWRQVQSLLQNDAST